MGVDGAGEWAECDGAETGLGASPFADCPSPCLGKFAKSSVLTRNIWPAPSQSLPVMIGGWTYKKADLPELMKLLVPLGHYGEAVDIAETILFLASEGARYITAETIHVDGGWIGS